MVRYSVDREGTIAEIEILYAASANVAWTLIDDLMHARVARYRIARYAADAFPVQHCVVEADDPDPVHGWWPPRVHNNW